MTMLTYIYSFENGKKYEQHQKKKKKLAKFISSSMHLKL